MHVMQTHSQATQAGARSHVTQRTILDVAAVGHRVPREVAAWRVHSVFASACNFIFKDQLLTLVSPRSGSGPTALLLQDAAPCSMERLFDVGEIASMQLSELRSRRVVLRLAHGSLWRQPIARPLLASLDIETNLAIARDRLAQRPRPTSVIDDRAVPVVHALVSATRTLDREDAILRLVERLVGWGEGLTPAGDDFLVGWLAALDALANTPERQRFHAVVAPALARLAARTTPIAAHFLRLAATGDYVEALECVRDAVLCESDRIRVRRAVDATLDIGATSGADMLSGLVRSIEAWLPEETIAAH
jgi:Protein of unknown function (DUF2877)